METYKGVEIKLHAFITSALNGGEWSGSLLGLLLAAKPLLETLPIG
jgi:hypothetical protein